MAKVPFRYKPLSSLENIHLLKRGSHTPGLDEGEYSDLYINKLPEVDILRVPDLQGPEPLFGDRRIIIADGHILSAYRHISRDDIQAWFNKIHDDDMRGYRIGNSISKYGKTMPLEISHEQVMWCNEDSWNPINTCPEWSPSYASRNLIYRKDASSGNGADWKIRREPKIFPSHDWQFSAMEPKMFVHFLLTKVDADNFKLPTFVQSGFRRERLNARFAPGKGLLKDGRKVAVSEAVLYENSHWTDHKFKVYEMSWDWWGTWEMTVGALDPPRGFDKSHKLKENFTTGKNGDAYWRYHHFEAVEEILVSKALKV